jgi:hypothetical protein
MTSKAAIHEAGHAVVFLHHDLRIRSAEIDPGGDTGRVWRELYRPPNIEAFLAGMVAGGVAQAIHEGFPISDWLYIPGIHSDAGTIRRYVGSFPYASGLFQDALITAEQVLRGYWPVVLHIAQALDAEGSLSLARMATLLAECEEKC